MFAIPLFDYFFLFASLSTHTTSIVTFFRVIIIHDSIGFAHEVNSRFGYRILITNSGFLVFYIEEKIHSNRFK